MRGSRRIASTTLLVLELGHQPSQQELDGMVKKDSCQEEPGRWEFMSFCQPIRFSPNVEPSIFVNADLSS
jgi:hypothetical protein